MEGPNIMSQKCSISRVSTVGFAVLLGLTSVLMFTQPVEAGTAKNNRVARRASRRGSRRARCKATKNTLNFDGVKTGESCPFKYAD